MKEEKVIFLDIDGVLTSWRAFFAFQEEGEIWEELDPVGVALLLRIVTTFDYKIVISSSWRITAKTMLFRQLRKHNLHSHLHRDWKTPQKLSANRGQEIDLWLQAHPEIKKYIILDDNSDMLREQLESFVQTDSSDGMLTDHYLKMKEIVECQKTQ